MKCTILGCGGSNGVPQIGCNCFVCSSENSKNKRTRVSILIESEKTRILVDSSPDLRQQALNNNIDYIDAVLYTHDHADHVMGMDDLKLMRKDKNPIIAYMDEKTAESLHIRFAYIFKQFNPLYPPILKTTIIKHYDTFEIGDIEVKCFLQKHDHITSLGFRFGNLVYSTDVNKIPELSFKYLEGVEHWILDCQRYHAIPSHAFVELILNWVARVKPKQVYLTHMSHGIEYEECEKFFPSNIIPSYDGMQIQF